MTSYLHIYLPAAASPESLPSINFFVISCPHVFILLYICAFLHLSHVLIISYSCVITCDWQVQRNPKTSRNTPQNGGVDSWVMRFHFWASFKPIFDNHVFRAVSEPFHPLYEAKISNCSPSVVYGSITLKFFSGALGTSPHQWFNRQNEIQKKCFFGTP